MLFERTHHIWTAAGRRYVEAKVTREERRSALERKQDWEKVESGDRLATRLKQKGMAEAMAASLASDAAKNPAIGNALLERIISDSNLLDISFLTLGARLSRGVARIQVRSPSGRVLGHGTGFLVSSELMMTNNHVLSDRSEAAASRAQFDYFDRINGAPPDIDEFLFEPQRFFQTNERLDFTLVAVAPSSENYRPLGRRPWNHLIRDSGKALIGEPVNIIQHPRAKTMKVACRQNKVVDRLPDFLHYETDTDPGSSGSKVCNDRWEIAALHHSGVPATDQDGRILLDDGSIWDGRRATRDRIAWVANEGVRISRIVEHLDGVRLSPSEEALWRGCFEPSPMMGEESVQEARGREVEGDSFLRRQENDGSASWYFRLNFGPAHQSGTSAAADRPTAKTGRPARATSSATPQIAPALSTARDIIERFRPDLPYFHEAQDQVDKRAYYKGIEFESGHAELFDSLHHLLQHTHTRRLSYRAARMKHLYPWVDLRENGSLRNVYSGTILDPAEILAEELERFERSRPGFLTEFSAADLENDDTDDGEFSAEELALESALPFNCEHVVPQSWFGRRQPMKADLHHLFACEPSCNSFRSNIPYFDFDPLLDSSSESDLEIERSDCGQRIGNKFEPEVGHGAVARATLYFLLRYPREVGDDTREMQGDRIATLISWHEAVKPTRYEKHRNAAIFAAQGNRNPLIDFPDIARKINFERGLS